MKSVAHFSFSTEYPLGLIAFKNEGDFCFLNSSIDSLCSFIQTILLFLTLACLIFVQGFPIFIIAPLGIVSMIDVLTFYYNHYNKYKHNYI